ncbi:MAG TPA: heat-inducible transcription repressor HrcA [Candidatus Scybalousia intestinigallinarum]|nr:heat-inducible transcription repressor HrcA [Candidatus Scybalousia intestinigallinarum]
MMLTKRQENILKLIVMKYIELAKPVSSNLICKKLKCSSATVRNEMAELENLGLLEKTHTSSGRVPSEAGYRYYVDHLMQPKEMNGEEMLKLQIIFKNQNLVLSDCLKKSLQLISDMTNYTSIVLGKASHENQLKEINVVPLDREHMIIIVITDKGHVEHKTVTIKDVSMEEIKKTVNLINDLIVGTPIDEVSSKLEFEIKPIIGRYVKEHEIIYNTFYQVFQEFSHQNVDVVGRNNMLKQPEFNNVDKIKEILTKLDDENLLANIETDNNDIKVYIGKENNLDDDVTIIKTTYHTPSEEGTIAIVGPKRMDYDRVVALLEYIKSNIEK